jgi:hypothetical protein
MRVPGQYVGYMLEGLDFYSQIVQSESGAQPASNEMVIRGFFPENKATEARFWSLIYV